MPTLPVELQEIVDANAESPPRLLDPRTNMEYVLLRAEAYERVRFLFESLEDSTADRAALLQLAGQRAGWEDPEMAVYDNYQAESWPK